MKCGNCDALLPHNTLTCVHCMWDNVRPPPASTEDSEDKTWVCSVCTVENSDLLPYCEACETPRGQRAPPSHTVQEQAKLLSDMTRVESRNAPAAAAHNPSDFSSPTDFPPLQPTQAIPMFDPRGGPPSPHAPETTQQLSDFVSHLPVAPLSEAQSSPQQLGMDQAAPKNKGKVSVRIDASEPSIGVQDTPQESSTINPVAPLSEAQSSPQPLASTVPAANTYSAAQMMDTFAPAHTSPRPNPELEALKEGLREAREAQKKLLEAQKQQLAELMREKQRPVPTETPTPPPTDTVAPTAQAEEPLAQPEAPQALAVPDQADSASSPLLSLSSLLSAAPDQPAPEESIPRAEVVSADVSEEDGSLASSMGTPFSSGDEAEEGEQGFQPLQDEASDEDLPFYAPGQPSLDSALGDTFASVLSIEQTQTPQSTNPVPHAAVEVKTPAVPQPPASQERVPVYESDVSDALSAPSHVEDVLVGAPLSEFVMTEYAPDGMLKAEEGEEEDWVNVNADEAIEVAKEHEE